MKKLDGFRDVFKTVKYRKPTQIFCPRCCSPKIGLNSSLDVWLTPRQYHCENCGYTGILVMELEEDKENKDTKTDAALDETKEKKESA